MRIAVTSAKNDKNNGRKPGKMSKTIGIICAMKKEAETLIAQMTNKQTDDVFGKEYIKGKLCGKDVVISVCGIGKVMAAACAQTMIIKYSPDVIINTGVAGSLDERLKIYDIVAATAVVQHDLDTTPLGDPLGYVGELDRVQIPADEKTVNELCSCAGALEYNIIKGIVASGDQFIADDTQKEFIKTRFGASACEMEGAAVGTVCFSAGVKFAVLRSISDSGDGTEFSTFVSEAVRRSAEVIKKYLSVTE